MLSKLVLGTAQFGLDYGVNNKTGQISRNEAYEILEFCKNNKIRYLDTAAAYGNSEVVIGSLLSTCLEKDDFEITTKLKFIENEDLYSLTKKSLKRIGILNIDSILFHSYLDYQKFLKFPKPDVVNKWGVSVYTNEELIRVLENPSVKIIQCPFNLLDNESVRGNLLRKAQSLGLEVQVRSAFLQGLFFMNSESLPGTLTPFAPYLELISKICKQNDISIQDLALGYCMSKEYIDKVVVGVDSLYQLKSNINSLKRVIPKKVYDLIDCISFDNQKLLNPTNW